jgi:hypothetical protein
MNSSNTNAQIDQGLRRLLGTATMGIVAAGAAIAVALVVWGGKAISAQDRYTLKIPGGGQGIRNLARRCSKSDRDQLESNRGE